MDSGSALPKGWGGLRSRLNGQADRLSEELGHPEPEGARSRRRSRSRSLRARGPEPSAERQDGLRIHSRSCMSGAAATWTQCARGAPVGMKTSSAYAPPELMRRKASCTCRAASHAPAPMRGGAGGSELRRVVAGRGAVRAVRRPHAVCPGHEQRRADRAERHDAAKRVGHDDGRGARAGVEGGGRGAERRRGGAQSDPLVPQGQSARAPDGGSDPVARIPHARWPAGGDADAVLWLPQPYSGRRLGSRGHAVPALQAAWSPLLA